MNGVSSIEQIAVRPFMRPLFSLAALAALPTAVLAAAPLVDPALPHYQPQAADPAAGAPYLRADGAISIVGYNDMKSLLEAVDRLFERAHPGIRFALDLPGTRMAPAALASGRSLLAPMGAEFSEAQLRAYRRSTGRDPLGIRVAHASVSPRALSGPLVIVVNPANPIEGITTEEAARIFSTNGSGDDIVTWGGIGGVREWRDRPIAPCGLARETALGEFMLKEKMPGRRFSPSFRAFGQSEDVIRLVAANPAAIGFARANLIGPGVKAIAVAAGPGGPYVAATPPNIVAGRYPFDRFLYIYVRKAADGAIDPLAREYLSLLLSREGQEAVAGTPQGYLPLNSAEVEAERAKLDPQAGIPGLSPKL